MIVLSCLYTCAKQYTIGNKPFAEFHIQQSYNIETVCASLRCQHRVWSKSANDILAKRQHECLFDTQLFFSYILDEK